MGRLIGRNRWKSKPLRAHIIRELLKGRLAQLGGDFSDGVAIPRPAFSIHWRDGRMFLPLSCFHPLMLRSAGGAVWSSGAIGNTMSARTQSADERYERAGQRPMPIVSLRDTQSAALRSANLVERSATAVSSSATKGGRTRRHAGLRVRSAIIALIVGIWT